MIKKNTRNDKAAKQDKSQTKGDLARIIDGLIMNGKIITDALKSRVNPGDWKLWQSNFELDDEEGRVDLVFSCTDDKKKESFALIDISVPHLAVGQKYTLPAKAKAFQKKQNVPVTRIKKAIILIRKGTETISARPARIRCPIFEIQLERILPKETRPAAEEQSRAPQSHNERSPRDSRPERQEQAARPAAPAKGVSAELLYALKEAIVHECLSTMHKRRNKYIRKGLWRWIEREIMDPNVHFYLIILSTIYQGKAGEVLSRRFKTVESYTNQAEDVISAIFSKETNLADEIKKASERHKKALRKFLACFSQTPPFEYLRSLFLKEFRSNQDGLKARLSVFTTLNQLLERCGFEGEKETQYPLEILDELGIFQGIMAGNYATLRIDNASKKLKHLVPQAEWGEEDVYLLRNQLAKALNLPPQEFNLNAFLPQAFVQDAKVLAEARKEAFRGPARTETAPIPQTAASSRPTAQRNQEPDRPIRVDNRPIKVKDPVDSRREKPIERERPSGRERPAERVEIAAPEEIAEAESRVEETQVRTEDLRHKKRQSECDEATHRNFEYFGGQLEEDIDSVRLALAMCRHEAAKSENEVPPEVEIQLSEEAEDALHRPPTKASAEKHFQVNHTPPTKKKTGEANANGANNANRNPQRRRRPGGSRPQHSKRPRRPSDNGVNR